MAKCNCSEGRPKCEKGRALHRKMTRYFLKNNLQVDDTHLEHWREWQKHLKHK